MRTVFCLTALLLAPIGARLTAAAEPSKIGIAPGALPLISHAYFYDANQKRVGEALLRETPHGVLVTVDLQGLPPGEHGFHLHEVGQCVPPFTSAGGHANPTHKHHGLVVPQGPHAGDLPNVFVLENGSLRADVLDRDATLMPGKPNSIVDRDGASLVIHADADDYATDPAGNSGDRIVCGVVETPERAAKGGIIPRPWEAKPNPEAGAGKE
jgi:Cu-Zn family superoxide dismutase